MKLESYEAPEVFGYDDVHHVRLKFLYGTAKAELIARMGGNVYGASLLSSYADPDLELTLDPTVPENKKHARFDPDDESQDKKYQYVTDIIFIRDNGQDYVVDIEEAVKYMIGIEIIGYEG